jgi:hypothetical protein
MRNGTRTLLPISAIIRDSASIIAILAENDWPVLQLSDVYHYGVVPVIEHFWHVTTCDLTRMEAIIAASSIPTKGDPAVLKSWDRSYTVQRNCRFIIIENPCKSDTDATDHFGQRAICLQMKSDREVQKCAASEEGER